MKLLLIINKANEETVNSVFSLAMIASATDDDVTIFGMGSGTQVFTKAQANNDMCCGEKMENIIKESSNIKVCMCVEAGLCKINESDIIDNVELVDMLELVQMIRDSDKVVTF